MVSTAALPDSTSQQRSLLCTESSTCHGWLLDQLRGHALLAMRQRPFCVSSSAPKLASVVQHVSTPTAPSLRILGQHSFQGFHSSTHSTTLRGMPPANTSAHDGVLLHSRRHLLIAKIGRLPSPGLRERFVVRALLCSGLHGKGALQRFSWTTRCILTYDIT